jgi:WD40 repeat protein
MADLSMNQIQASVSGEGDFTFYDGKLALISAEGYVKFFEISNKTDLSSTSFKLSDNITVDKNATSIASNGKDVIAYSTKAGSVFTVFRDKFDRPNKIAQSQSEIHKLVYPNKKVILLCSKDKFIRIYWIEEEKVTILNPHHQDSVLYGDVDPDCQFIATTGCDGNLFI